MAKLRTYKFEQKEFVAGNGGNVQLEVAVHRPQVGTGIPGYPETAIMHGFQVENPIKPLYIDVEPECEPHFVVHRCLIAQNFAWCVNESGVPAKILNAHPAIDFPLVHPAYTVLLQVKNISTESHVFRATLTGDEDIKVPDDK